MIRADHIVLFAGHMVDLPVRDVPRFPPELVPVAEVAIRDHLRRMTSRLPGRCLALSAAARGGDILFLEACRDLGIPYRVCLPFDPDRFLETSVEGTGPDWVERYRRILASAGEQLMVMPPDNDPFVRFNLWLLDLGSRLGDHVHLLALWDGMPGDGPGGTEDLVQRVRAAGGTVTQVNPRTLRARPPD